MKILHTADWHLGRQLYGVSLVNEQAYVLQQVVEYVKAHRPDLVIVAGDIYDRPIPPPEAIELLDEVIAELVVTLKTPTILIAGNHDSPPRLNFSARVLALNRLHIITTPCRQATPIVVEDEHGPVYFYCLPFCEPRRARHHLAAEEICDHHSATHTWTQRVWTRHPAGARAVLVGHAFAHGGTVSDSERDVSLGGAGVVGLDCFAGFHYVALGHLHGPQWVDARVHYAGSPLKYSLSELGHSKSVTLVELDSAGACTHSYLPLTPRRDLRLLTGLFDTLLNGETSGQADDYIVIRLTDEDVLHDPMNRLRERYPQLLHLERSVSPLATSGSTRSSDYRDTSALVLFEQFFEVMNRGKALSPEQKVLFQEVVAAVTQEEGE